MTISAGVVLLTFILFLADKAIGGVASEYGKRIWFKAIEPLFVRAVRKLFGRSKDTRANENLAKELTALDQEIEYLKLLAEGLIAERDALLLENIELRLEKHRKSAG